MVMSKEVDKKREAKWRLEQAMIPRKSGANKRSKAQVKLKCSGKNCRALVEYTPWVAPVAR